MERYFDTELQDLKKNIMSMGVLVEQAIIGSVEALKNLDEHKAQSVICDDQIVDQKELLIDEQCLDLLALRQPMAIDLRFITMAMKISTDLERMADLAVDIAQRVIELHGKPLLKPLVDIPKLANLAYEMTHQVLNAFINKDAQCARRVILDDRQADELRDLVQEELLHEYIAKDSSSIPRAVPLLLIARHLERICDHATNIAEDVIYMVEAKVVKHNCEPL